ncbi:hypothetical protein L1887_58988 [Cichorium endivia]|nr:hypothetical protein L1887_58988 [Cichorium endivia]
MRGIQALFVRRDEVEEAWKWVDSITEAWAADQDAPKPYQAGTWGPVASVAMITRDGRSWNEFDALSSARKRPVRPTSPGLNRQRAAPSTDLSWPAGTWRTASPPASLMIKRR